jgi:hypothetical protein
MLLTTDKIPFLLTVLLAMFAWTTNQLSLELGKSPTIELSSKKNIKDTKSIEYLLTNISNTVAYSDIRFVVKLEVDACKGVPRIELGPPNMKGVSTEKSSCENKKTASFHLAQFHPGSKIKLVTPVDLIVNSELYVRSNTPVRIIESSVESFVIKYKVLILAWFFAFWLLLIGIYLIAVKRGWLTDEK